ncbi:DUF2316 family protein [Microbacterium timonense]|uniref:DUF2316 family protein n=1 Tax=Microbacterium timonense TaxID=2086576 RepID=UPI00135C1970
MRSLRLRTRAAHSRSPRCRRRDVTGCRAAAARPRRIPVRARSVRVRTEDLAQNLGWDHDRLERTLAADPGSNPVDLWTVRDHLHVSLKRSGMSSPFTVLSSTNRLRARRWFGLPPMPRR